MDSLNPIFSPSGIVLIGASQDPGKLGYILARNLIQSGFPGKIHFVNPKGGHLFDQPIHQRVSDVPDPVDLAVILVPASAVPDNLRECGQRGIRAAIISSGGFRETGESGEDLENTCLHIAREYKMRLMGPNCVGLIDTHLPMNTSFLPHSDLPPGEIAFVSQSGAICDIAIDWARSQGFGLSLLVSLGNQADVSESDVLAPVAADPHTRVLAMYLEGVRDGRYFIREARQVSRQKPILALKVGKYSSGQRAAASHTGALAGQESAYEAAFRRAGVIRAGTTEELFDWARALAWCPPIQGPSIAILTNAGGLGVIAADAVENFGLTLADLTPQTQADLRSLLPPAASVYNPVDMLGSATPEQYASCLKILLADPGVHGILIIIPPPPVRSAEEIAQAIIPVLQHNQKPVIVALIGDQSIQKALTIFHQARIPEYRYPEKAASALAALFRYSLSLSTSQQAEDPVMLIDQERAQKKFTEATSQISPGSTWLSQEAIFDILSAYQIPVPPARLAHSAKEAVEIARQLGLEKSSLGFALKIVSPDILHKSDIGGVLLNLRDAPTLESGFEQIMRNARSAHPQAVIQGILVQPTIPPGQEVIIGAVQDAQFGPLVMFGSGGVEVEGLKDIAFALAPLSWQDAEYLLEKTWAGRKLRGYRALPPADRSAVLDTLFKLAQLTSDFPEIAEIEINPLRVLPDGMGVFALDARLRIQK
jgi:acetyl coenzyme A synthetase (ADP forming)-like protein